MKRILSIAAASLALVAIAGGPVGCSPCDSAPGSSPGDQTACPRPAQGEFSVMTFNLSSYVLVDPGDASGLAPRPREGDAILIDTIRQASPDILAVQEMGNPAAWTEFKASLRQAGLAYGHEEYLRNGNSERNLAVLSRFPIVARNLYTNDLYTIGPAQFPVQRGILEVDLEVNPAYRLRLMIAHLKSKVYHEYGQAEMRRNEARLLNNHVRSSLVENPNINLLVVGDLNDTPSSKLLGDILTYQDKPILQDLRPTDASGNAWTCCESDDSCQRLDYMLVSAGLLPEVNPGKTYAIRSRALLQASNHRPLVATFAATEREAQAALAQPRNLPAEFPEND